MRSYGEERHGNHQRVDIVSAEGAIWAGEANLVIAPARMGDVGIAPRHAPMMTTLRPGDVRVQRDGQDELYFYVTGGILEVQPTLVTVLADTVLRAEQLDESAADEARKSAEEALKGAIDQGRPGPRPAAAGRGRRPLPGGATAQGQAPVGAASAATHFRRILPLPPLRSLAGIKPLKHEHELFKAALVAAVKYAEDRGAVVFEPTDSASDKLLYVYRLLVHDKKIAPLPENRSPRRPCGTAWPCGTRTSCRKTIRC